MPRVARVVITYVAHHVTQRGNGRQFILASDAERLVYLDLLRQALREQPLSVLEQRTLRRLTPGKGGRPCKAKVATTRQSSRSTSEPQP